MKQKKRHHFVPKAYLNSFCDKKGRILIYRKDAPSTPLHVTPEATQFRRYYYSQPTPAGGQDNNTLEDLFSEIESAWPATVEILKKREGANSRLENIFQFMALQRARVPATRDMVEAMLAQTVKDTMQAMLTSGKLPPPPLGLEDLPNNIVVSIDPHRSIHAMVHIIQGMEQLYSRIGFAVVHNTTDQLFLTSDNPVLWFDPSLPFDKQLPYTIDPDGGPIFLAFTISPKLILIGSKELKDTFDRRGLQHREVPNEEWVNSINAQVCRFAYEAVIATDTTFQEMIAEFSTISPVHTAVSLPAAKGMMTIHQQVFGARTTKPKWQEKS